MDSQIRAIEHSAIASWPAAEDTRIGTWLVRRDRGYTKRANCIYAFPGEPDLDLDQRLADCFALMTEAGLPIIVRESSTFPVRGLAESMNERKMYIFDGSLVMTRSIEPGTNQTPIDQIDVDRWLDLYLQFEGGTKGNQVVHKEILERISAPTAYGVLLSDDRPVSIGLAVAEGPWLGLFDIATDPRHRGRGHGAEIVERLLAWGASVGCIGSYLQVMASNATAQRLYTRLGFREEFRYHYYGQHRS